MKSPCDDEFLSPGDIGIPPLKQAYSLPLPVFNYFLSNTTALLDSKLFRSCKRLNQVIPDRQVDVLEIGISKRTKLNSIGNQLRLQVHKKSDSEVNDLFIRKRVLFLNVSYRYTAAFLKSIDYSMVKEVFLLKAAITVEEYKKLMIPSIEVLYASSNEPADGFDILNYTLEHLPNLRMVK